MQWVFNVRLSDLFSAVIFEDGLLDGRNDASKERNDVSDVFAKNFVDGFDNFVGDNLEILCRQMSKSPKLLSVSTKRENEMRIEMRIEKPIPTSLLKELKVREHS